MASSADGLPPGPSWPPAAQTAAWIAAPGRFLRSCFERYGPTFTLSFSGEGPCVWLAEPDDVRAVFSAPPGATAAGAVNWQLAPALGARSILLLDGEEHLAARRLMLPPFHGARLAEWAGVIADCAARDAASWAEGRPLALRPRTQAITLDAILRVVLGAGSGPAATELRSALTAWLAAAASPLALVPALRRGERRPRTPFGRFVARRERVRALLRAELRRRRAALGVGPGAEVSASAAGDDVISTLAAARDERGGLLDEEAAVDQLVTLVVAGHETTATALAWAFAELARRPDVLAGAATGDDGLLDAIVRETLRLHPPIPVIGRALRRPLAIGGRELPAGTVVAPAIWLVHRRGDLYPDPDAFRPERFIGERPGTAEWLPFGGGIRRCLGASFAELEMRTVIREVAAEYELRPAGRPERETWRAIVLAPARGGRVAATRRSPRRPRGGRPGAFAARAPGA